MGKKVSLVNNKGVTAVKKVSKKSDATIGKVHREIVISFQVDALSARDSQSHNLACGGRGVDQNGIGGLATTIMPLNPATNKAILTVDADIPEFLGEKNGNKTTVQESTTDDDDSVE